MADPDEALIEAIAAGIRSHRVEVWMADDAMFGWHCLTCGSERDPFTRSVEVAEQDTLGHSARAAYAAMVEHLGLTEEVVPFCDECGHDAKPVCPNWHDTHPRRLVTKWREVQS